MIPWISHRLARMVCTELNAFLNERGDVAGVSVVEGEVHWTGNGSGESWLIKANSPTTDLAIELLTYLRSDEVYSQYVTETQSLPSMGWAAEIVEDPNVATMGEWPSSVSSD